MKYLILSLMIFGSFQVFSEDCNITNYQECEAGSWNNPNDVSLDKLEDAHFLNTAIIQRNLNLMATTQQSSWNDSGIQDQIHPKDAEFQAVMDYLLNRHNYKAYSEIQDQVIQDQIIQKYLESQDITEEVTNE